MPTIELTDEELQGLIMVCANASGPGVSWMLTNALLTKAQAAAQASQAARVDKSGQTSLSTPPKRQKQPPDGFDLEPHLVPSARID